MAAQGLILLDISILMESRSPQVFAEQVELYPGAKKMMDWIEAVKCACSDPMCLQNTMQGIFDMVSGGNKEAAARYLEKLEKDDTINSPEKFRDFNLDFAHNQHAESWLKG